MLEYADNDLGEQTETRGMGESHPFTQKSEFDLKLAEKWSQLMAQGSFRYCSYWKRFFFTPLAFKHAIFWSRVAQLGLRSPTMSRFRSFNSFCWIHA